MLIKPESFFDEVVDGLLREGQSLRTEMIPEEIESLLDTPHRGLVGGASSFNQSEHIGKGSVILHWSASPAERLLNTERNLC